MKRTILSFILIEILLGYKMYGQIKHFVFQGKIEFVKTVNTYAILGRRINKENEAYSGPAFEHYKQENPQFRKYKSILTFGSQKALYTPLENQDAPKNDFFGGEATMGQINTVYMDLNAGILIDQKKVFEETFLVKDSLRNTHWKITSETREIAGFTCRRANALILDSIYVVAFYTDQIPVSSGPELFSGLPGMILEVSLPHENMTWLASSVTESFNSANDIQPPKKGKSTDFKGLKTNLLSVMKSWGNYAQYYLKSFFL